VKVSDVIINENESIVETVKKESEFEKYSDKITKLKNKPRLRFLLTRDQL